MFVSVHARAKLLSATIQFAQLYNQILKRITQSEEINAVL